MNRALILGVNAGLVVLCCFLAARVVAVISGEMLAPEPTTASLAHVAPPQIDRSWGARQIIITRNPFNASTLAPAPPPVDEAEEYAKTKLPLRLLGTVAHEEPSFSWAAIEDLETRSHEVVRVGDRLKDRADVLRIERRRIVLQNGTRREELALEEDEGKPTRTRSSRRPRAARAPRPTPPRTSAARPQVERLAENRFAVTRSDVQKLAGNPSSLLNSSQGRILPRYENGQMVGFQVNAIRPGSLWQQIGVQDGDTITELNGIRINGQEGGPELLRELSTATRFDVTVTGRDGAQRKLQYEVR